MCPPRLPLQLPLLPRCCCCPCVEEPRSCLAPLTRTAAPAQLVSGSPLDQLLPPGTSNSSACPCYSPLRPLVFFLRRIAWRLDRPSIWDTDVGRQSRDKKVPRRIHPSHPASAAVTANAHSSTPRLQKHATLSGTVQPRSRPNDVRCSPTTCTPGPHAQPCFCSSDPVANTIRRATAWKNLPPNGQRSSASSSDSLAQAPVCPDMTFSHTTFYPRTP